MVFNLYLTGPLYALLTYTHTHPPTHTLRLFTHSRLFIKRRTHCTTVQQQVLFSPPLPRAPCLLRFHPSSYLPPFWKFEPTSVLLPHLKDVPATTCPWPLLTPGPASLQPSLPSPLLTCTERTWGLNYLYSRTLIIHNGPPLCFHITTSRHFSTCL